MASTRGGHQHARVHGHEWSLANRDVTCCTRLRSIKQTRSDLQHFATSCSLKIKHQQLLPFLGAPQMSSPSLPSSGDALFMIFQVDLQ